MEPMVDRKDKRGKGRLQLAPKKWLLTTSVVISTSRQPAVSKGVQVYMRACVLATRSWTPRSHEHQLHFEPGKHKIHLGKLAVSITNRAHCRRSWETG